MVTASLSGDSLSPQPQPDLPRRHLFWGLVSWGERLLGPQHPLPPIPHAHVISLLWLCPLRSAIIPALASFLWVSTAYRRHTRPRGKNS